MLTGSAHYNVFGSQGSDAFVRFRRLTSGILFATDVAAQYAAYYGQQYGSLATNFSLVAG